MTNRPRNVPEWTIVDFIHRGAWWRNRGSCKFAISSGQSCSRCELTGILLLNLCLLLPLMTSSINGFDSSLVNGQSLHALAQSRNTQLTESSIPGLQIVPDWKEYFHEPHGKALGMINSAQNVGALVVRTLLRCPFHSPLMHVNNVEYNH